MPGAVVVIQSQLPQRTARKGIQLVPLSAGRELKGNQRQEAFKHCGVVQTLLWIDLSPGQGTRRVRGAVAVLPPGIIQVKVVVADGLVAGLA